MTDNFVNMNMDNLRDTLCEIIFGDEKYKKYIIPLQGNWASPTREYKANTWVGYVIDSITTDVQIVRDNEVNNRYLRSCTAAIHLMFAGVNAEKMAQSVFMWSTRQDVKDILDNKYKGQLQNQEFKLYTGLIAQEGANDILSWNIGIEITYNMLVTSADKQPLTDVKLVGNMIIE